MNTEITMTGADEKDLNLVLDEADFFFLVDPNNPLLISRYLNKARKTPVNISLNIYIEITRTINMENALQAKC
jgi:hypothetical protein